MTQTITSKPSPQAAAFSKPQLPLDAKPADAVALLVSGKWSQEDYLAWQTARESSLSAKKQGFSSELRFKVSEKGALSVYGLQARFPVTLYAPQWERLLELAPQLRQFIADNAALLSREKPAKPAAPAVAPIAPAGPTLPPMNPAMLAQLAALLAAQPAA